jgi:hypothetical protein
MDDASPEGPDEAWVREELARLPAADLQEEVLTRLLASVRAEAALLEPRTDEPAPSLPRQREGERAMGRRGWILAGAGIAAAGALVLSTAQPWRSEPATSVAEAPGPDRQSPEVAAGGYDAASVAPVLRATGTAYTADAMAMQVERSMTVAAERPLSGTDAAAVAACLRKAVPSGPLVLIDLATYEGVPALVVASLRAARWDVVVQARTCTAQDPALLARATVERRPAQE